MTRTQKNSSSKSSGLKATDRSDINTKSGIATSVKKKFLAAHQSDAVHEMKSQQPELDLNPAFKPGMSRNISPEYDDDADDDDADDDDLEELPEEEQQQMQQLTSFVDAAYRRVDQQRSGIPTVVNLPDMESSMSEVELSGGMQPQRHHSHHATVHSLPAVVSAAHSFTPLPLSGHLSSIDSQSTHTSDFLPSAITENTDQLLQQLQGMPDTLEKALTINQVLQRRIAANIERLEEVLKENLRKQLTLHDEEDEERTTIEEEKHLRDSDTRYFLRISSFCRPYFKTKIGMPAPMNEDARCKIKGGYLDMYQTRYRPWSQSEQRRMRDVALSEARNTQLKILKQREDDLRRQIRNAGPGKDCVQLEAEVQRICKEAQELRTSRSVSLPQDLPLDWIKIAAQAADGHRTPDECQHLWQTMLSPNISQNDFAEKDDIAIQSAVKGYGRQKPDWIAIAQTLSEPRSAYQVFRRYQSYIAPALNPLPWTEETRDQLVELVGELRVGEYIPWSQVHQQMPGFSRTQLQAKWKKIDPERRKGPFTRQEDYVFLKGLLKFGLNYPHIVKFMPRRNTNQLKDRFRRTIVSGFLSEWTKEMDAELQQVSAVSRLNTAFWRRLAIVPGFATTGKDAGMLRLRYLILRLWREVSLSDEPPPPLFPVSVTTNAEELNELRTHFLNADTIEQRAVVDRINAGNHIKSALQELSNRRRRLHQEHDHHHNPALKRENTTKPLRLNHLHMHHMHLQANNQQLQSRPGPSMPGAASAPALDLRGLCMRRPSVLSWPERLILDFFLPSTVRRPKHVDFDSDSGAVASVLALFSALQVRPLPVQQGEMAVLSILNITPTEMAIVNSVVQQHTCRDVGAAPCVWCPGTAVPECMPLLPPSFGTVTALQSILLHRPALQTMAQGTFVLHRFTGASVRRLGDKPRPVRVREDPRRDYESGRLPMPGRVGKVHITTVMKPINTPRAQKRPRGRPAMKGRKQELKPRKARKKRWRKRSIVSLYKCYKTGRLLPQYPGAKRQENATTDNPDDPGIVAVPETGKKQPVSEATTVKQKKHAEPRSDDEVKPVRYSPKKKTKEIASYPVEQRPASSDSDSEGEEEEEEEQQGPEAFLSAEERRARAEADNLLWHRFVAVFLWPSLLTLCRPTPQQQQQVEDQFASINRKAEAAQQSEEDGRVFGSTKRILEQVQPKEGRRKRRRRTKGGLASNEVQVTEAGDASATPAGGTAVAMETCGADGAATAISQLQPVGGASGMEAPPTVPHKAKRSRVRPPPCRFSTRKKNLSS